MKRRAIKDDMVYHGEYRTREVKRLCVALEIAIEDKMSIDCMLRHEDGDIDIIIKRGKIIKIIAKGSFKGNCKIEMIRRKHGKEDEWVRKS